MLTETTQPVPAQRLPRHVAVIMDGNGRWASRHGLPRIDGHRRGSEVLRAVCQEAARLGIRQITAYCLSTENWKRPQLELDFLIHLLGEYLVSERAMLMENQWVLKVIGRRDRLPPEVRRSMDETIDLTRNNTGMVVCLAVNYGARGEIVDAIQCIARETLAGRVRPDDIDEPLVSRFLYTAGMSDPDLVIRTAGEQRVSNFLLWQISYAELWTTEHCWPEFEIADLHQAIRDYAARVRRYGGLDLLDVKEKESTSPCCNGD
jgi:undecaprenyl diphosphate synthase